MPENVSILQQIGVAVLAAATVIWAIGLVRILRRDRVAADTPRDGLPLRGLPRQAAPSVESVELTPAERDAFAGLVRQLGDGGHR